MNKLQSFCQRVDTSDLQTHIHKNKIIDKFIVGKLKKLQATCKEFLSRTKLLTQSSIRATCRVTHGHNIKVIHKRVK